MKKSTFVLLAATLGVTGGLAACSKTETEGSIISGSETEITASLPNGEEVTEDQLNLKDDGYFKEIVTGNENPKIKFESEYHTDWHDDSWEDVDFKIDKLKVVEVDKFKGDEEKHYKGLFAIHYTLENKGKEEVKIHPDSAKIVLTDGTEIDASHFSDYWEDVFSKDKKKDGYIHFKFDKVDEIDKIKEIHVKFDGRYKDNDDKDKVDHEYNVQLPLDLAK
ncbi:hypothetical protein ACYSNO_05880 [Enterococcus sp. LJL98]